MRQYIVDAFTDRIFGGNPAAVCVVEEFPPESVMKAIAVENNLSETAFTCRNGENWNLRWFTPAGEIDFCGHATLGTAFALLTEVCPEADEVQFATQKGTLLVRRHGKYLEMDFPAYHPRQIPVTSAMEEAIGAPVLEACLDRDLLLILEEEEKVRTLRPDIEAVKALDGLLLAVSARGSECDCVSRIFAPKCGVPEDPVTGSAHCMIVPYWAKQLGKMEIDCEQASARGGQLRGTAAGDRVILLGQAVLFSKAELQV